MVPDPQESGCDASSSPEHLVERLEVVKME